MYIMGVNTTCINKPEMIGFKLGVLYLLKNWEKLHNSDRNRKKKEKMRRKITQRKIRKPTAKKTGVSKSKKKK